MKVICKFNDPTNIPNNIPDNFDYGLEIGKEYLVMGILTFKESNELYFLTDEKGRPSWFPYQLFEVVDNRLSQKWFLKININREDVDYYNLMGYDDLCNKDEHFNNLLERNEEAMLSYFRVKIDIEKEFKNEI